MEEEEDAEERWSDRGVNDEGQIRQPADFHPCPMPCQLHAMERAEEKEEFEAMEEETP